MTTKEREIPASVQGTTAEDSAELVRLEGSMRLGYVAIGKALVEIHDRKLYRSVGFQSFDSYCEARWSLGHSTAYRLIDAARVVAAIEASPVGDTPVLPQSESVARELAIVKKADDVCELWRVVLERHGERPSAVQVAATREVWLTAAVKVGRHPDVLELETARVELEQAAAFAAAEAARVRAEEEAAAAQKKRDKDERDRVERERKEAAYLARKAQEDAEAKAARESEAGAVDLPPIGQEVSSDLSREAVLLYLCGLEPKPLFELLREVPDHAAWFGRFDDRLKTTGNELIAARRELTDLVDLVVRFKQEKISFEEFLAEFALGAGKSALAAVE